MKTIRYIGPHTEGVLVARAGGTIEFPHGEPVDVDDELAGRGPTVVLDADDNATFDPGEGLLAQDFELVDEQTPPATPAKPARKRS